MLYQSIESINTPDRHKDIKKLERLQPQNFGSLLFNKNIDFTGVNADLLNLPRRFGFIFWFAVLQQVLATETLEDGDLDTGDNLKAPLRVVNEQKHCFIADIKRNSVANYWEVFYVVGNSLQFNAVAGTVNCLVVPSPVRVSDADFLACVKSDALPQLISFFRKQDVFEQNNQYPELFKKDINKQKQVAATDYLDRKYYQYDKTNEALLKAIVERLQQNNSVSLFGMQRFIGQLFLVFTLKIRFETVMKQHSGFEKLDKTYLLEEIVKKTHEGKLAKENNKCDFYTPTLAEDSYDPFSKALLDTARSLESKSLDTLFNKSILRIEIPKLIASLDCSVLDKYCLWMWLYDAQWLENNKKLISAATVKEIQEAYFPAVLLALETIYAQSPFVEKFLIAQIPSLLQMHALEQRKLGLSLDVDAKIFTTKFGKGFEVYESAFEDLKRDKHFWYDEFRNDARKGIDTIDKEVRKNEALWSCQISTKFLESQLILKEDRTEDWLYCVSPETWLNYLDSQFYRLGASASLVNFLRENGQLILIRLELPANNEKRYRLDFSLFFPVGDQAWHFSLYATPDQLKACQIGRIKQHVDYKLEDVGSMSFDAEEQHNLRTREHRLAAERRLFEIQQPPLKISEIVSVLNTKVVAYLYPKPESPKVGMIGKSLNAINIKTSTSPKKQPEIDFLVSIIDPDFTDEIYNTHGPVILFCLELIFLNPQADTTQVARILTGLRNYEGAPAPFLNVLLENLKRPNELTVVVSKPSEMDYQDPLLLDLYIALNTEIKQQKEKKQKEKKSTLDPELSNIDHWQMMLLHLNKVALPVPERTLLLKTLKNGKFSRIFPMDGKVTVKLDEAMQQVVNASQNVNPPQILAPLHSSHSKPVKKSAETLTQEISILKKEIEATRQRLHSLLQQDEALVKRIADTHESIENFRNVLLPQAWKYKELMIEIMRIAAKYKHVAHFFEMPIMRSDQTLIGVFGATNSKNNDESLVLLNYKLFYSVVEQYTKQREFFDTKLQEVDERIALDRQLVQFKNLSQKENAREQQLIKMMAPVPPVLEEQQFRIEALTSLTSAFQTANAELVKQSAALHRFDNDVSVYQRNAKKMIELLLAHRKNIFYAEFNKAAQKELGSREAKNFCKLIQTNMTRKHAEINSKEVNRFRWFSFDWRFLDWLFGNRTAKARLLKIVNTYENAYQKCAEDWPFLLTDSDELAETPNIKTRAELEQCQAKILECLNAQEQALSTLQNKGEKSYRKLPWLKNFIKSFTDQKTSLGTVMSDLDSALTIEARDKVNVAVQACNPVKDQWMNLRLAVYAASSVAKVDENQNEIARNLFKRKKL